jgi:AraC-like DNA-binding protein/tetratricopeptide (TPR) repeat protein
MRGIAWDRAKAALETAAAQTRKRIKDDRGRASRQIKPLLTTLKRELFNPDLTVKGLLRSCKVRDHNVVTLFRQDVGESPARYIRLRRLETAALLLASSEVLISDVALLVGYLELTSFSRSFRDWIGFSPTDYRRKERGSSALAPMPRVLLRPQDWDCAERGALDDATLQRFLQRFRALYPRVQLGPNTPRPVKIIIDGARLEGNFASDIWEQLEGLPFTEQYMAIRHQFAFTTPALFKLLSKRSREEGRKDSARGVVLAELALASIEASAEVLGDDAANHLAEAWARVGNARRLASDYPGAAKAFAHAWGVWQQPRSLYRPEIEAEISIRESALRMNQRHFDHAAELADTAVRLARSLESPQKLAQFLIQRGSVSLYNGDAARALIAYQEARDVAKASGEIYFEFSAHTGCCLALIACKSYREATAVLERAADICNQLADGVFHHQVQWLHALLASNQNQHGQVVAHFQQARTGFIRARAMDYAAVVSLDLALLYHRNGQLDDLVPLLTEALPALEALQIDREYLAAVKLLRQALIKGTVSKRLLGRVRDFLRTSIPVPHPMS